jgi:hypothetical protein
LTGIVPGLLVLVAAVELPVLCIDVEKRSGIDEQELVAAMRARVEVRVVRCRSDTGQHPTWRLSVASSGPEAIMLRLVGEDVHAGKNLGIGGQSREEIVQLVSLTAAEAVRPSMKALLNRMGLEADPPASDLVAQIEDNECTPTACSEPKVITKTATLTVNRPVGGGLQLIAGPLFGTNELELSGFVELRGFIEVESLSAALHVGVNILPSASIPTADLGTLELELGLSAAHRWSVVELGLRAQSRLSFVSPTGSSPDLDNALQLFWNGGLGALLGVWLWESSHWEVGISGQVWVWPQPNRFLVAGEVVRAQSYVELLFGPMLRLRFSPNSF